MLTESLGRPELYRRRDHGEDGGAAETKRAVRAVLGSSGVLGCTGHRVMSLRSKTRGQLGTRVDGGERIGRAAQLIVERLLRDSGEVGPGLRGRELGKLPGCTAVLLRGSAGVERQWGGVSAAAQSLCTAEQGEAVARVFKKARARGFGRACPGRDLGEICGGFH